MEASVLLQASGLTREFGGYKAVQDVNLNLMKGEVLGLLGPNGAGKSTTMQLLTGNLAPTRGEILINNIDLIDQPNKAKQYLGYLPENPPIYKDLTVNEYLTFCAQLHKVPSKQRKASIAQARQQCDLDAVQNRLINNLSKGFKQRVGIAQAILHEPAVVILDEPTVGLDPIQIQEIRHLIRELGREHAVILSTHILPEVQAVCDRVQIMYQGKTVFSDSMHNLTQQTTNQLKLEVMHEIDLAPLQAITELKQIDALGDGVYLLTHTKNTNIAPLIATISAKNQWTLKAITPLQNSLEQIFMTLVHQDTKILEAAA